MASRILSRININTYNLKSEIDFLNSTTKLPEEYDAFGQGQWKNISLYNESGISTDSQYRNTEKCKPTEYAWNCPEIQRLSEENFKIENLKMVRARSLIDGMVITHRDCVECDSTTTYLRVFIPLKNNNESFHSDEYGVFQMGAGEAWFLDAAINHAAVNFGRSSRMCLCLDFMAETAFDPCEIFTDSAPQLEYRKEFYINRKPFSEKDRDSIITATSRLLSRSTFKDLIFTLSKHHFIYDTPIASSHDWIIAAAEKTRNQKFFNKATLLRTFLIEKRDMSERYTINDWTV